MLLGSGGVEYLKSYLKGRFPLRHLSTCTLNGRSTSASPFRYILDDLSRSVHLPCIT